MGKMECCAVAAMVNCGVRTYMVYLYGSPCSLPDACGGLKFEMLVKVLGYCDPGELKYTVYGNGSIIRCHGEAGRLVVAHRGMQATYRILVTFVYLIGVHWNLACGMGLIFVCLEALSWDFQR